MSSKFGNTVVLSDLDDFISPSQACVNPMFVEDSTSIDERGIAKIQIGSLDHLEDSDAKATLIRGEKKAQVSLSDCLACSGCVTSAETVLLEKQSLKTFQGELDIISFDFVSIPHCRQYF